MLSGGGLIPILALLLGCIANEIVVRNVGTDTGTVADTDVGVDPERLALYDAPCDTPGGLAPFPGEEGHLVGALLEPPATPFVVTDVEAVLSTTPLPNGEACNAGHAQELVAWVVAGEAPPANRAPDARWTFPALAPGGPVRALTADVSPPLRLGPGERLVLALPYPGAWPDVSCVQLCAGDATASFWSNADAPPYAWGSLSDLGFDRAPALSAEGSVSTR